MDRYGLEIFLPADRRNATVLALLERGYADRMFLSQDYCATIDWYPVELANQLAEGGLVKGWSMTLLFEEIIPQLRRGRNDGRATRDDAGRQPPPLARGRVARPPSSPFRSRGGGPSGWRTPCRRQAHS